jgi:hypothetical protein
MLKRILRDFFRLGVNTASFDGFLENLPAGITADASANFGLIGLFANLAVLDFDLISVVGGASTAITLTGTQFSANVIDYSGSPGGGVTMTTPTAAQIFSALPASVPAGGINWPLVFINDSAGQTVTLTAGTGVTVVGTATIATATVRLFLVNALPASASIINCGGWSL